VIESQSPFQQNETTKKAPFPILGSGAFLIKYAQHKPINPPDLRSRNSLPFTKAQSAAQTGFFPGGLIAD